MESKLKAKYIVDIMDETTKEEFKKLLIAQEILFKNKAEQGIDLIELAQVMLSMSREAMVDVYGEVVADSYIKQQISYLKNPENSLTLH